MIKVNISNRLKLLASIIIVIAIWVGFVLGQGGKNANVFSQRFCDKSFMILSVISVSIIILGFCIEYRKWLMLALVLFLNGVLVVGLFMTISIWTVIMVNNQTDEELTAVSIDCTRDIIRLVKLSPKTKRSVAITESENRESVSNNRYVITVYDKLGEIYYQEIVRSGDVERIYTIDVKANEEEN